MDKEDVFAFIRRNPIFHLATTEGNKPHVRRMAVFQADESGIIFHVDKTKDVCKQLAANPNVEMCFDSNQGNMEIRISGIVEVEDDEAIKKQIDPDRYDRLAVYRIRNGLATVWTPELDLAPKSYIVLGTSD